MRRINDDELKKIQFALLKEFKNVCELIKVNYSLIGGTLLGAFRHKGFIPWDDDIDVCMTRDDYHVFCDFCFKNKTNFVLLNHETNENYGYLFAKLYDPNTIQNELLANRKKISLGVHIDLFIYDAMGDTYKKAKKEFNKSSFKRELLVAANWKKYQKSKTHSWVFEPIRFCLFLLSRPVQYDCLIKKIEKIYTSKRFESISYVANLASDKRSKSIIERSCFDKYVELEFEGELFKVFQGYETYLKSMYGDYMKLPPEEKRITHHTFEAFYKE